MNTIPASQIVQVTPNVLSAGGQALDIIGLILTTSTRVPIGTVQAFASDDDVGSYFGLSSDEYNAAQHYFLGFDNSNVKPSKVLYAQYNSADVASYLRGGSMSGIPLATLKAFTPGTLTINVNGTPKTSSSINLAGATSFSNAATIIQAAFTSPGFAVTYDSVSGAFIFSNSTTGPTSTMDFASGSSLAASLKLTLVSGAVLSQGASAATPGPFMDAIVNTTQNWATFMTIFDPDVSGNTNKLAFSAWANNQNNRFGYVCWDTDDSPATSSPAVSSLGYLIGKNGNNYSGTFLIGSDVNNPVDYTYAAYVCGAGAAIDFTETNGRITFAFKKQSGLAATCTNASAAQNLISNGYNFYGAYATANDQFVWMYPGQVSGPFLWFDSYINEIWLNNQLQLALMVLLGSVKSIPYNSAGYALIEAACLDVINQGLNFGAFRPGVTLSQSQAAQVNSAAGVKISDTLNQQGWYLQVKDAAPQVRAARGSPPCTFWYMDGQAVQKINLTSVNVQ